MPGLRLRHQRSYVAKALTDVAHDAARPLIDKNRQDFTISSGDWVALIVAAERCRLSLGRLPIKRALAECPLR